MATIVTRAGKGSALTHTEMDANFTNLNIDKAELSGATFTGTVNLTSTFQIGGIAVTSTAAELNLLDGVTSTTAELNILDGVTSTAAELNILDGVTSTATELNVLDGILPSTTELNYVNGVTSAIQTQLNTITANDWVTASRIASGAVGASEIAANAVGTSEIAANAVASEYATTANGAVGAIAFLMHTAANTAIVQGSTYAGSGLSYAGISSAASSGSTVYFGGSSGTPSGTWRALGRATATAARYSSTVFIRIS